MSPPLCGNSSESIHGSSGSTYLLSCVVTVVVAHISSPIGNSSGSTHLLSYVVTVVAYGRVVGAANLGMIKMYARQGGCVVK